MRILFYLTRLAVIPLLTCSVSSCIMFAGLSGPVYSTDTDLQVKRAPVPIPGGTTFVNSDTVFTVSRGTKYRIVDVVAGTNYIKMMHPNKKYQTGILSTRIVALSDNENENLRRTGTITAPAVAAPAVVAPAVVAPAVVAPAVAAPAVAAPAVAAPAAVVTYHLITSKNSNHELFIVEERDMKPYQRVLTAQVAVGTMILPLKIRGPIDYKGTHYERQFSTDVSIGPFIGYRFKVSGNDYKPFTTIGVFAGPTLINYVSSTNQTGSPLPASTAPASATPDNMFAFTYGIGAFHEISGFQIGVVYGWDRVSGKRVTEWPYDGKGWFSLGIGYNFLGARQ